MTDTLASVVERFLTHRRALGRKYHSEQAELRLLVRFAHERRVHRLDQLTPALIEEFLGRALRLFAPFDDRARTARLGGGRGAIHVTRTGGS